MQTELVGTDISMYQLIGCSTATRGCEYTEGLCGVVASAGVLQVALDSVEGKVLEL